MGIFAVLPSGNGLSASARRTVKSLRKAGEDLRVLSGKNHEAKDS